MFFFEKLIIGSKKCHGVPGPVKFQVNKKYLKKVFGT